MPFKENIILIKRSKLSLRLIEGETCHIPALDTKGRRGKNHCFSSWLIQKEGGFEVLRDVVMV